MSYWFRVLVTRSPHSPIRCRTRHANGKSRKSASIRAAGAARAKLVKCFLFPFQSPSHLNKKPRRNASGALRTLVCNVRLARRMRRPIDGTAGVKTGMNHRRFPAVQACFDGNHDGCHDRRDTGPRPACAGFRGQMKLYGLERHVRYFSVKNTLTLRKYAFQRRMGGSESIADLTTQSQMQNYGGSLELRKLLSDEGNRTQSVERNEGVSSIRSTLYVLHARPHAAESAGIHPSAQSHRRSATTSRL
jgi:hypothetical protein